MAWNEPGGGKEGGKDPWGNKDDQGPPDLDEAFRKLQNNLAEMFGGKKGSGSGRAGGGGGFSLSGGMAGAIALVLVLVWAGMGVYSVDQQEQGVVLRFGEVQPELVGPGLHWNPKLIDRVLIENVTRVRDIQVHSDMLTEDENIVKVRMSIQFVIGDVEQYLLRVRSPVVSLQHATESALRHEVGSATMNEVLTEGRQLLGDNIKIRVQNYMLKYGTGIQISQVNIDETAPPESVRAAFDDVIKAREDEVRVLNEADAYSNQVIPEARGQAQRLLEEAEGYKQRVVSEATGEAERFNKLYTEYSLAPEVTRDRIYIDTLESVMSNSTKIMIDVEGGNNLLYLPLDKLMENSNENNRSSGYSRSSGGVVDSNDTTRRNRRDRN
ncbi:MAG: FtsH protease activity modulator HflK [Pseudomonadales bacterium]|nr:FtsH protease activity modulator HflK [Pseudomonadales bacterium]